jgi:hypothetical protein
MLLPLQGGYVARLTPDRALPYPNAQALSGLYCHFQTDIARFFHNASANNCKTRLYLKPVQIND